MDKIGGTFESITGTGSNTNQQDPSNPQAQDQQQSGGLLGGLGDKLSSVIGGGGGSGEKTDDGIDQEKQSNESGVEQAGDEQVSEFIRSKYKSSVGDGNPVQDAKSS